MEPPLYAVILAGGSGTRFWPASRAARPKQFLPLSGGRPMIAATAARLEGLVSPERIFVVTAREQVDLVHAALPELPAGNVLAEPEPRNTAPAVALAAHAIGGEHDDCVQIVLPADHVVSPPQAFRATLSIAVREARAADRLVLLGVRPSAPTSGFGYIEKGELLHEVEGQAVHQVTRFVEKPAREVAAALIESGRYLWNAGVGVWRASVMRAALARFLPAAAAAMRALDGGAQLLDVWATIPALPIDVAVLERADNVCVLPIDYAWSDIGSWATLAELIAPDAAGNRAIVSGSVEVVAHDARDCLVYAEGTQAVALLGVRDLVVVHVAGATLVCPRERAQDVRAIVEELRRRGSEFA